MAAVATRTQTVDFEFEKDTKNTRKFTEVERKGEPLVVGTLYVQKWFAGDAEKLSVTVELA